MSSSASSLWPAASRILASGSLQSSGAPPRSDIARNADIIISSSPRSLPISAFSSMAEYLPGSLRMMRETVPVAPVRLPEATCCLARASAVSRSSGSRETARE